MFAAFNAFLILSQSTHIVGKKEENFAISSTTNLLHFNTKELGRPFNTGELGESVLSHDHRLTGSSSLKIAAKLNQFAATHPSVQRLIPCTELDVREVSQLASALLPFLDEGISTLFASDDGRQLSTDPWKLENSMPSTSTLRDGLCAETMKMWAHHMPQSAKNGTMRFELPTLPPFNKTELTSEALLYNRSMSCVAGHHVSDLKEDILDDEDPYAHEWPHWPKIMHFKAKAHGPYPFWQFGPPKTDTWDLSVPFSESQYLKGVDLEVWHNTPHRATKFYHARCEWSYLGFPELGTQACAALHLNTYGVNGSWYLFTVNENTQGPDEAFCCEATLENNLDLHLGTINRKFVDEMKYIGEYDFAGDFYVGQAKRYVLAMAHPEDYCPGCAQEPTLPINVWYETDMYDRPLRFGELGQELQLDGYLHDLDLPLVYEEFNVTSFLDPEMRFFSKSVFDVPRVCTETVFGCHPGRVNRNKNSVVWDPKEMSWKMTE